MLKVPDTELFQYSLWEIIEKMEAVYGFCKYTEQDKKYVTNFLADFQNEENKNVLSTLFYGVPKDSYVKSYNFFLMNSILKEKWKSETSKVRTFQEVFSTLEGKPLFVKLFFIYCVIHYHFPKL